MTSHYPRREKTDDVPAFRSPRACTDLPFLPPPDNLPLPPLPCPPRDPDFAPGYTLTTHLVPACYPRFTYLHPSPYKSEVAPVPEVFNNAPPDNAPKSVRHKWSQETGTQLAKRHHYLYNAQPRPPPATSEAPALWIAINRYARRRDPKDKRDFGLTVVMAHANGMHKETWEPTILHLIGLCEKRNSGICIDEVWSIDAVNHGDSGLVNEKHLMGYIDWLDHTRDIIHFVENYIPDGPYDPSAPPLPTHLPRLSPAIAQARIQNGLKDRHLVGVGHSWSGCCIVNAAISRPNLFLSLNLVDPVITWIYPRAEYQQVAGALARRQTWPSREEAKKILKQNPFFAIWHPDVLDLYVKYGLADSPDGTVRLKTDRFHEASTFADGHVRQETWNLLPSLDERVKLRFIMPKNLLVGNPEMANQLVWRRIINTTNVIIDKSVHLMVQQMPYEVAKEILFGWRVMLAETQDPIWARLKL